MDAILLGVMVVLGLLGIYGLANLALNYAEKEITQIEASRSEPTPPPPSFAKPAAKGFRRSTLVEMPRRIQ